MFATYFMEMFDLSITKLFLIILIIWWLNMNVTHLIEQTRDRGYILMVEYMFTMWKAIALILINTQKNEINI